MVWPSGLGEGSITKDGLCYPTFWQAHVASHFWGHYQHHFILFRPWCYHWSYLSLFHDSQLYVLSIFQYLTWWYGDDYHWWWIIWILWLPAQLFQFHMLYFIHYFIHVTYALLAQTLILVTCIADVWRWFHFGLLWYHVQASSKTCNGILPP